MLNLLFGLPKMLSDHIIDLTTETRTKTNEPEHPLLRRSNYNVIRETLEKDYFLRTGIHIAIM